MGNPMHGEEAGKSHARATGAAPARACGAKTRKGTPCTNPAMPNGRCRMHGGGAGRPIEHGKYSRYSVIKAKDVVALREHFESDPDPLNLIPDLLEIRVRVAEYCNRSDEVAEALLSWRASFSGAYKKAYQTWREEITDWEALWHEWRDAPGEIDLPDPPEPPRPEDFSDRPREVKDILHAATHLRNLADVAKKIHDIQTTGTITLDRVDAALDQLGLEVVASARAHIEDDEIRQAFLADVERRWNDIPLGIDRTPSR